MGSEISQLDRFDSLLLDKLTVIKTKYVSAPSITGISKPTILLPLLTFTDKELNYILQHELQHFKSRDMLFKIFIELLCIMYWWNPAVFILRKQLENLMELRVDAVLSKKWNEEQKTEYLECLLKAYKYQADSPSPRLAVALISKNEQFILKRAQYFLKEHKKTPPPFIMTALISILIISSVFVFEPAAEPPEFLDGSFTLSEDTYIIKYTDSNKYVLYMDGNYMDEVTDPYSDAFIDVPIYIH